MTKKKTTKEKKNKKPARTNIFVAEFKKMLEESGLKQVQIEDLSKRRIKQGYLAQILHYGTVPTNLDTLDELARILNKPVKDLRRYAWLERAERELDRLKLTWEDVNKGIHKVESKKLNIPLFKFANLKKSLSIKGYPSAQGDSYIYLSLDDGAFYTPYTYAVLMDNPLLYPRVRQGEIAIFSNAGKEIMEEEYGMLREKIHNNIHVGRIIESPSYIIVESQRPSYSIARIQKRDILYIHKVVGVLESKPR